MPPLMPTFLIIDVVSVYPNKPPSVTLPETDKPLMLCPSPSNIPENFVAELPIGVHVPLRLMLLPSNKTAAAEIMFPS